MSEDRDIVLSIRILPIIIVVISFVFYILYIFYLFGDLKLKIIGEEKNLLINKERYLSEIMVDSLLYDISTRYNELTDELKENIKNRVYEVSYIIRSYIKHNANKPIKEIKKDLKLILSNIIWEKGNGYYFGYDYDTNITTVHKLKRFLNKDMSHFKDKSGQVLVELYRKVISNPKQEGFATIYFVKPTDPNHQYKKIVFVKYIKELNWVIGTGEYIVDAEEKLKNKILLYIQNKRYGKDGYFWVHNTKGILLAHPYRTNYIGKNDLNLTDKRGHYIVREFIKAVKMYPNGTFISYYWYKPSSKKMTLKIAYLKLFKPWNWIIGSGVYLDDVSKDINNQLEVINYFMKRYFFITILVYAIFIILSLVIAYYLSKKTEEIFLIYKDNLEEKIDRAVKENIKKDKIIQYQNRLAAMGDMIAAIAHQWRQPLNVLSIKIQTLLLLFKNNKLKEEDLKKEIDSMKKIIFQMSDTIDSFRNFFKKDREKELFSVKNSINDILEILQAQLSNHNINVEIEGEDFEIFGFKNDFKEVILNLISNSKDAMIERNIRDRRIKIILDKNNKKIEVIDNAGGIDNEIIDKIFEPYFTTKDKEGIGIGLYMSKMIIEDHFKGKLKVENIDNGAKFTIEFPKEEEN